MFYTVRQRFFDTFSKHHRYLFIIIELNLLALALGACTEVTKLIPSNQEQNTQGLSVIDFSPAMTPQELLPNLQEGNSALTLQAELKAASKRFADIERPLAAARLNELVALHEKLNALGQSPELSSFWSAIPAAPAAARLEAQSIDFAKSTPALKTSFLAALQSELPAPLVERFSNVQVLPREPVGFQVLVPPESFYSSLATAFDPSSATALEMARDKAGPGAILKEAAQKLVAQEKYRITRSVSQWIFVRSFQPKNAFQGFLECSKVRMAIKENMLDSSESANDSQGSPSEVELSFSWPRLVSLESTDSAFGLSRVSSSKLRVEYRPSIALILPEASSTDPGRPEPLDSGTNGQKASLANIPVEYELNVARDPDFVNSRYQANLYDGAGSATSFTLFHEAKKLFLFRFGAAVRTPYEVNSLYSSFQIPFGKLIIENNEQRNEYGLNKDDFSEAQKEFLTKNESLDGVTTAPQDKWSNASAIQFYRADNNAYPPAASPETKQGGIHFVNRTLLSQKFSNFFPVMKWRKNASDSDFLQEEDFETLQAFCTKSLESQ